VDKDARDALEARFTKLRIVELQERPVQGRFDAAHLREVNRRIFQDLPALGVSDVTPGEYRDPVPIDKDWVKQRELNTVKTTYTVAYSPMSEGTRAALDHVLERQARPEALSQLKPQEFIAHMADLYTQLDMIHPFVDGNSRTLREFTRELAEVSGYHMEWERIGTSSAGRDILYIARDVSVNRLALPHLKNDDTRIAVGNALDRLDGNRDLEDVLKTIVRPSRAVAFERLTEIKAIEKHPELQPVYDEQRAIRDTLLSKYPDQPDRRSEGIASFRETVLKQLDAGNIIRARQPETALVVSSSKEIETETSTRRPPVRPAKPQTERER
jgi:cell filamentation protein